MLFYFRTVSGGWGGPSAAKVKRLSQQGSSACVGDNNGDGGIFLSWSPLVGVKFALLRCSHDVVIATPRPMVVGVLEKCYRLQGRKFSFLD